LEGLGGRKGKGESEVGSIEFGENIPCEKLEIGGVGLKGKRGRIKEENKRIEDGDMGVSLRRILETEWGVELCSGSTVEGGGGG
jgi:hypothetical protein